MELRFDEHDADGIRIHFAAAGDPAAPLLICLHGFPEYWAGWRSVMEALVDAYFVVAPDQRGYNRSSRPADVSAYRAGALVADLASLADALSPGRPFALAGHDWGASIAYAYAFAHAERLSHLVIANGVHPICFQRAIFEDPAQRAASQYINRLRAPDAEARLAEDGYRRAFRMLEGFSATGWMTPELRTGYLEAWSRPGALTAMLNWYRASPILVPEPGAAAPDVPLLSVPAEAVRVAVPHLVVWGEADQALRPSCLDGLAVHAPELTVERLPDAGHWILHERPAEAAARMRAFLSGQRSAAGQGRG